MAGHRRSSPSALHQLLSPSRRSQFRETGILVQFGAPKPFWFDQPKVNAIREVASHATQGALALRDGP
jgi:hypothetical protein